MITSYCTERWELVSRSTYDELPSVIVRRISAGRATSWRLVKRPNGWYNVGQWIHIPGKPSGYRPCPEPKGVKLSGSRTDLTLHSFAEAGHGHSYD